MLRLQNWAQSFCLDKHWVHIPETLALGKRYKKMHLFLIKLFWTRHEALVSANTQERRPHRHPDVPLASHFSWTQSSYMESCFCFWCGMSSSEPQQLWLKEETQTGEFTRKELVVPLLPTGASSCSPVFWAWRADSWLRTPVLTWNLNLVGVRGKRAVAPPSFYAWGQEHFKKRAEWAESALNILPGLFVCECPRHSDVTSCARFVSVVSWYEYPRASQCRQGS